MPVKETWIAQINQLQHTICAALEAADGKAKFLEDRWERPEGGGGNTRVLSQGALLEKAGVNSSVVFGAVTEIMKNQLQLKGSNWFACGLSIVLHPVNPYVPTVHCNYRMFELYAENGALLDRWFGGGADLTPYYLFEADAIHFHQTYKTICDRYHPSFYPNFKKNCDDYFVNWHRQGERRGIGGIFFDQQRPDEKMDTTAWINFAADLGAAFTTSYLPIAERRKNSSFTGKEKQWQEIRRGRYVEFNLVHDRGTLFGLKTNGRIESILMSLPPTVRFEYDYHPVAGSPEDQLLQTCLQPRNWL